MGPDDEDGMLHAAGVEDLCGVERLSLPDTTRCDRRLWP